MIIPVRSYSEFVHSFIQSVYFWIKENVWLWKASERVGGNLQLTLVKSSAIQVLCPLAQAPIWTYCAEEEWIAPAASQKSTRFSRREQCLMKGLQWMTLSSVIGTVTVRSDVHYDFALTVHCMNGHLLNPLTSARQICPSRWSKWAFYLPLWVLFV